LEKEDGHNHQTAFGPDTIEEARLFAMIPKIYKKFGLSQFSLSMFFKSFPWNLPSHAGRDCHSATLRLQTEVAPTFRESQE
jgi:hypothetical protein